MPQKKPPHAGGDQNQPKESARHFDDEMFDLDEYPERGDDEQDENGKSDGVRNGIHGENLSAGKIALPRPKLQAQCGFLGYSNFQQHWDRSQKFSPSPLGEEGRCEGERYAEKRPVPWTLAAPHPNPLPQGGEGTSSHKTQCVPMLL